MKVLQLLEATGGGARKHVRQLVCGLSSRGLEIDVIVSPNRAESDFGDDLELFRGLGCKVFEVPLARLPTVGDRAAHKELQRIIRLQQPQIVHAHCFKAGYLGRTAAKAVSADIRTVYTPHAFVFDGLRPFVRNMAILLERKRAAVTDLLLCISEAEKAQALTHRIVPASRMLVAPNGIPADFSTRLLTRETARRELQLDDNVTAVGVLARLVPQKGHEHLLEALNILTPDERQSLQVLCFGDGELELALQQRCHELGLTETVRFLGYRPQAERFLPGLDFTVLPSAYEGLSYSLLESLAAGVPVLASNAPGNCCGSDAPVVYFSTGNARELATRIHVLAHDTHLRGKLVARAQAFIAHSYSLDRQLDVVCDAYKTLVEG